MTAPATDARLHGAYTRELTNAADAPEAPAPQAPAPSPAWHPAQRVAFRFAFAYLALYALPILVQRVPVVGFVLARAWYATLWGPAVEWSGAHVLGMGYAVRYRPGGSGDQSFDWALTFCQLVAAVVATVVWSVLDRRRLAYPALHDRLRVGLRYALALTMVAYGAAKIFQGQFPPPSLERLIEPYGQSSPMGLAWTFMGHSYAYSFFGGLAELVGGLLLFWRRTTTLGALASAAVLLNVVMINLSFDVPVKLLSSHLLAIALVLALPDLGRLARFLLLGRAAEPADQRPRGRAWLRWPVRAAVKASVILLGTAAPLVGSWQAQHRFGKDAPTPALYGIYDVETFARNGVAVPALFTDSTRWRRFVVNRSGMVSLQLASDTIVRFRATVDTTARSLALAHDTEGTGGTLGYARTPAGLVLTGTFDRDTVRATLRRVDERSFLLVRRGFHWVNEFPLNR